MMVYNVLDGKIYDVTGRSVTDLKKGVIRTFMNPHFVCRKNPLVILRALKFQLRYGFKIDTELQKAMITYASKLFDGRFSDRRLRIGRMNVEREDKAGAQKLFKEYGLEKIMEV
jgi:tRNA nucleotidyltransferase/poly(A) polymerase